MKLLTPNLTSFLALSLMVSAGSFGGVALAESAPGFLEDYRYQVTNLSSMEEAQALMDLETHETRTQSVCSDRAEIWSYQIYQKKSVKLGKVFIHFTDLGQADENGQWSYHVAPYVLVNGKEMVLDAGFGVFQNHPVPMSDWMKYFGKSPACVVLDPIHNPKHLAYEQNNLPNDYVTPLTYKSGGARQYPSAEAICYVRKSPAFYVYPIDVYAADIYFATGNSDYAKFKRFSYDSDEALQSCKYAMTLGFRAKVSCASYLGI